MTNGYGFSSSAGGYIRLIRANLRDRYTMDDGGFAILKELVQNADDAGATMLHIGWTDSVRQADHPLLDGPALFMVNNGPFPESDERQLRRFGENSKAGQAATIGKFGLGLKSVFHLCEAFFYLASRRAQDGAMEQVAHVLNPWASGQDGHLNDQWNQFPQASQAAILSHLGDLFGSEEWFCLWLPLRRQQQLTNCEPITKYYPGDGDELASLIANEQLPEQLGMLLPLLGGLEEVRGWTGCQSRLNPRFKVRMDARLGRRRKLGLPQPDEAAPLGGWLLVDRPNVEMTRLPFAGSEAWPSDSKLQAIENHALWPSDLYTDPETGKERQVREKAERHAAVFFAARPAKQIGQPRLAIQWSVFLPLSEPETVPLRHGSVDIFVSLHGYFFIDAGRNRVEGLDRPSSNGELADEAALRHAWNHRLATLATLPLLPAALRDFRLEASLDACAISALTAALQKSGTFQQFRASVCSKHDWILTHRPGVGGEWRLCNASDSIVELPESDGGIQPEQIFPALRDCSRRHTLVIKGTPRLSARVGGDRWPDREVTALLDSVPVESVVRDEISLAWLLSFLHDCLDSEGKAAAAPAVAGLLRRAMQDCAMPTLLEHGALVRQLTELIPPSDRRALTEPASAATSELVRSLVAESPGILLLPVELDSAENPGCGKLSADAACRLLSHIASWRKRNLSNQDLQMIGEVSAQLLAASGDSRLIVRERSRDHVLFAGHDCSTGELAHLSLNDLFGAYKSETLFAQPPSFAQHLQDAVRDERILLISAKLFRVLFQTDELVSCRHEQLMLALKRSPPPRLARSEDRRKLLKTLIEYQAGQSKPAYRTCVRYLLHGDAANYETTSRLLVAAGADRDIWFRTTELALQYVNARWRLISASLGSMLSDEQCQSLQVDRITADSAVCLLRESGPACLAGLEPNEDDYAKLLRGIADDALLKSLPIHQSIAGEFVTIDERTFWTADFPVDPELQGVVHILRRSSLPDVWAIQQRLARPLDAAATIKIALDATKPHQFWRSIMDALARLERAPDGCMAQLRSTKWLPSTNGEAIRPEDIIHLPAIAGDVATIAATYRGTFYDEGILASEARHHAGYKALQKYVFLPVDDALDMLGELLHECPANSVGELCGDAVDGWLDSLHGCSKELMPCYSIVKRVHEVFPIQVRRLFSKLTLPIDDDRILQVLAFLKREHEARSGRQRKVKLLEVHNEYLSMLLRSDPPPERLQELPLPTQAGTWRLAAELCLEANGISSEHLLDESTGKVWPQRPHVEWLNRPAPLSRDAARPEDGFELREIERLLAPDCDEIERIKGWKRQWTATAIRLTDFFQAWRGHLPDEQIGGFLALMGDDSDVRDLATKYLGHNRTLEQTRANLGLADDAANSTRIVVGIARGKTAHVKNLFGEEIVAPKSERVENLFVGFGSSRNPFPRMQIQGQTVICLRLNEIDPAQHSAELSRLLLRSTEQLLSNGYHRVFSGEDVSATFEDLTKSDQLDIRIAQALILDNAFLHLDTLGLRADPEVDEVLRRWDKSQRRRAEQELSTAPRRRSVGTSLDDEIDAVKEDLRNLLETNKVVQASILNAICHRIQQFEYDATSVPFEVFQNADDAYVELAEYFKMANDSSSRRASFDLIISRGKLTLLHCGRRINQYAEDCTGRAAGFDSDLWKMLVLSLSNKCQEEPAAPVTGKFGMGFKSVFLVCEQPRIASGRLAFEVHGGIYPRALVGAERSALEGDQDRLPNGKQLATVIELPLRQPCHDAAFAKEFLSLAHFLLVFARQIRTLRVTRGDESVETISWQELPLSSAKGCFHGTLEPLRGEGAAMARHALVLRTGQGALLLALDGRRFGRFDRSVPSIWVKAPTRDRLDLGFLIDGPFMLDVGRAQLARSDESNRRVAREMSIGLGQQLCDLFLQGMEGDDDGRWTAFCKEVGLPADADRYGFWESLWDLLAVGLVKMRDADRPAYRLIYDILWGGGDQGASTLFLRHQAMPTGMAGDYRGLTSYRNVRFYAKGILAKDASAFEMVSHWRLFREHAKPLEIVTEDAVYEPLRRLLPAEAERIRPLPLAAAIEWELPSGPYVDMETAVMLGAAVTRPLLDSITDPAEKRQLAQRLRDLQFKGSDGRFHAAASLLIGDGSRCSGEDRHDDERRRARFAPSSAVLDSGYQGQGLAFFEVCREKLSAPVKLMAEWTVNANDESRRRAALEYLADGEQGAPLQKELGTLGTNGTWLEDVRSARSFKDLSPVQQHRLAGLFPDSLGSLVEPPPRTDPRRCNDAGAILNEIYEWWSTARDGHLSHYVAQVYPAANFKLCRSEDPIANHDQRRAWMALFILGLAHAMGRTRPEQHRGFLDRCSQAGWLDTFVRAETKPSDWLSIMSDYFESQNDAAPFLQWMKHFFGIFAIASHLDDYIEAFLAIDRAAGSFSLTQITEPRTSTLFQGGGISAPAISRLLGIGGCFIVRELARLGVITNRYAYPHCYVPARRIRKLFTAIGCEGLEEPMRPWERPRVIWDFVKKHMGSERSTFMLDFDIPFGVIAGDPGLQRQFFEAARAEEEEDELESDGW